MQTISENEIRKQRGMQIAQTCRIMKREKGGYIVPSQSGSGAYVVQYKDFKPVCECPDCEVKNNKCKHIWAVELTINKQVNSDGSTTITKTAKMTYSQNWSAYDEAKTKEKSMFLELLNDLCKDIPNTEYTFGRPKMPLSEMLFASALKVYTTFSLRRFVSDMQTAHEKGYVEHVPHYSTVALYMEKQELTPMLLNLIQKSSLPLKTIETDFSVDSSGFGTSRFDRWYSFKYGKEINSRRWLKAHVMNGVKTHIITGIKITEGHAPDSPQFAELVEKTAEVFQINEVTADKAYSSRENLEVIASHDGKGFIPFKSNATGKTRGSKLWGKMYHYFMFQREDFMQHYHKRSNAETIFHMMKSKFGDSIRSKTETAQINEVLLKALCHNICVVIQEIHELGIEPDFMPVEKVGGVLN